METHKILDRFEMLYPLNSKVADLRRACIDKDLHSVFRLIDDDTKEDLRKIILEDNQWSLWKILDSFYVLDGTELWQLCCLKVK